ALQREKRDSVDLLRRLGRDMTLEDARESLPRKRALERRARQRDGGEVVERAPDGVTTLLLGRVGAMLDEPCPAVVAERLRAGRADAGVDDEGSLCHRSDPVDQREEVVRVEVIQDPEGEHEVELPVLVA